MTKRYLGFLSLALLVAQVLLVLVSWLLSATQTAGVRSLLSAEGLRWFLGHYAEMLLTPLLSWVLLGAMAWGCVVRSGLDLELRRPRGYRQLLALRVMAVLLVLYVGVLLLLTVVPHALLLSATGSLWPSPWSNALVPLLALGLMLAAVGYGLPNRAFTKPGDVFESMAQGVAKAAPLLLLYVLAVQLYKSLCYVFI